MSADTRRRRDAEYQRARRRAGLAWDQQPENLERARERKRKYLHRLVAARVCTRCKQPIPEGSGIYDWACWDCEATRRKARRAEATARDLEYAARLLDSLPLDHRKVLETALGPEFIARVREAAEAGA